VAKKDPVRLRCEQLEERQVLSTLDLSGVEFRTIDGTNNNAALPLQGAAETEQIRFGYGQRFPDGFGDLIITPPQRANPRSISNAIHAQTGSVLNDRHLTDWVFQWGQWITHDMDLTRNGPEWNVLSTGAVGNFSIPILDPGDPLGPNPIPFNRSQIVPGSGVPGDRRDVINSITSYIDASMVYGSDAARAAALRTFHGGKLKTSSDGKLLPLNTSGLPNADQFGAGAALFLAGDVRANEQSALTVVHTLFVREHNRLANKIYQLYPTLTDEQIYQVARRLVGAEMQAITYKEYLPAVLGYDLAPSPHDAAYDPAVNAAITNSFAHAAFRFGHSQISPSTLLVNGSGQTTGQLSIRDAFFNPDFLKNNPGNVERVLRGLAFQLGQENDLKLVDGIRNNLFGPPGAGGLDLAALDIQRGRDHGLPDYNNLRNAYGLEPVTSFAEISSDPAIQAQLEALFGNVDNIDLFVGVLAEDHLPGSSAGETIHAIVGNQFERLRDGDRFFYTNDPFLASDAVRQILDVRKVTLSKVIRWNTGIDNIQDNAFFDKSVLFFEAGENGANVKLVTTDDGKVKIIKTNSGEVVASKSLSSVSQVILVGSELAPDTFNLFVATAGGGIEDGVQVYGRNSTNDVMNVYGTSGNDTFVVTPTSAAVNGNSIYYSGLERIRLVKKGGNDSIQIDPNVGPIVDVVDSWNPEVNG
jgi:peroxidase